MTRPLLTIVFLLLFSGCASVGKMMPQEVVHEVQQESLVGRYDAFRGERIWSLPAMRVESPGLVSSSSLSISALAVSEQRDSTSPPGAANVMLTFASSSHEWRYLNSSRRVTLLLDHKSRLELGDAAYSGDIVQGGVQENLSVPMSRNQLDTLVAADVVDGQVGTVEFRLTPQQLSVLRVFAGGLPGGV